MFASIARRSLQNAAVKFSHFTTKRIASSRLMCSATNEFLSYDIDDSTGIASLIMNRKPVNSLNLEFLTQIQIALEKLENEKSCKGLILTSEVRNIFSAGLDILEMYQPQPERLAEFWRTLQEVWLSLYGTRLSTVAAITGHAPAGGCLLSLSCDYRVMADGPFTIGLNETLLGIVAPFWFMETMKRTIGHRETEKALQLGKLYSVKEAMSVGLIDESVEQTQVVETAKRQLQEYIKIPEVARSLSKNLMRKDAIERLQVKRDEDVDNFVRFITTDGVQKTLELYLKSLKKKAS